MENPNNGVPGGPRGPNDPNSSPAWFGRDELANAAPPANEERRNRAFRHRYEDPVVHAQVQRLFPFYNPPLYVRMRGYSRERSLATAEGVAGSFVGPLGRHFTDTEMRAFTEHLLSSINTGLAYRWGITGLAALLTFRGRKTFRFPFFKPRTGGALDPFTGGAQVRAMWHLARFGAYYTACLLTLTPIAEAYNSMSWLASMKKDPRLADVMRESAAKGSHIFGNNAATPQPANPTDEQAPSWPSQRSPGGTTDQSSYGTENNVSAQAQAAWSAPRQAQPPQEAAPPERSDKWDTFSDDLDDASPVAPSMRASPDDSQGGISAWDRIRQQSQQPQSKQNPQRPQQSWQAPQGMGAGDDNASPQSRGLRDSYSFSSADEEKAVAKGQAQKEFDEMLDRERRGVEHEQRPWGRK
ncbi:hypothetical protein HRG_010389 [Hirsutella rhossiliensis]|uniref:Uncharacterized protein n=1 Tax=Hirsutella rhossiliensis TaxID=111463 RepID=A0A9P8MPH8_9HYPO|nr:uncharacterized protein HRG_10389 [Hirsutella rhossiliensis]KAH0958702.1 hypothetical protein HRG_10389 [Hirsutella rhossiliensis]